MGDRIESLAEKLERGARKSREILSQVAPDLWTTVIYPDPPAWTLRDLLAHFVSAEVNLLQVAQDVGAGGAGVPEGFDYDSFNAAEQQRLAGRSVPELLSDLEAARARTLAWLRGLPDEALDRVGRHPALGEISLESIVQAIYGHQLVHMREVQQRWSEAAAR